MAPIRILLLWLTALVACATLAADPGLPDGAPAAALQAIVTTAADEVLTTRITAVGDGTLTLATDPPRTLTLAEVARIDLGGVSPPPAGDLVWIGQDDHDLVQVGSASGGNGVQDLHLRARRLRPVPLQQVAVTCRFPGQLRVWRLDTERSPHWRLAIERLANEPEAELYLEPASVDSFGHTFDVQYTYADGTTAAASVVATTHTSNQAIPAARPAETATRDAEVFLDDGGRLRGGLASIVDETLALETSWNQQLAVPLVRVRALWFGNQAAGGRTEFDQAVRHPTGTDQVFVLARDNAVENVGAALRGLDAERLRVRYEGQDRTINRQRALGVVLAAHPPLAPPGNAAQTFTLASGDTVSGRWVAYEANALVVETDWNARLTLPAEQVRQIRVQGGRVASLVDLEPASVEETPYFGRTVSWRRDAGFEGQPARLRGKPPLRCLAVHSRCRLTYALDGQYDRFKTIVGFDDSAGPRGRVACRVLVDGRQAFADDDLRADADPREVDVALDGAAQLTLEIDFGAEQDVGDRVLWAEPRLFRAEHLPSKLE